MQILWRKTFVRESLMQDSGMRRKKSPAIQTSPEEMHAVRLKPTFRG